MFVAALVVTESVPPDEAFPTKKCTTSEPCVAHPHSMLPILTPVVKSSSPVCPCGSDVTLPCWFGYQYTRPGIKVSVCELESVTDAFPCTEDALSAETVAVNECVVPFPVVRGESLMRTFCAVGSVVL